MMPGTNRALGAQLSMKRQIGNPTGAQDFDQVTDRLLKQIRLEKFVGSPEVSDAVSKINLQNYFNGKKAGPDYGARILDIVNTQIE